MAQKRILIVDDNFDSRWILTHRLEHLGDFEITEASNGWEALSLVEANPPDLIFMDLKMPILNGWDATRAIRQMEVGTDIPIIALTAQAMVGDEQKALAAGCDDYLTKPVIDPDLIRRKLARLLTDCQLELV